MLQIFCSEQGKMNQKYTLCGLQTYYKDNKDITKLAQQAAVLPHVPQHLACLVEDVRMNALKDIGEAYNIPDKTSFRKMQIQRDRHQNSATQGQVRTRTLQHGRLC